MLFEIQPMGDGTWILRVLFFTMMVLFLLWTSLLFSLSYYAFYLCDSRNECLLFYIGLIAVYGFNCIVWVKGCTNASYYCSFVFCFCFYFYFYYYYQLQFTCRVKKYGEGYSKYNVCYIRFLNALVIAGTETNEESLRLLRSFYIQGA